MRRQLRSHHLNVDVMPAGAALPSCLRLGLGGIVVIDAPAGFAIRRLPSSKHTYYSRFSLQYTHVYARVENVVLALYSASLSAVLC